MENQKENQNQKDLTKRCMSELTPIQSLGSNKSVNKKVCEKHGEYDCETFHLGHVKYSNPCPLCMDEAEVKLMNEEIEISLKEKKKTISTNLEKSGIPLRFTDKELAHLHSKNTKQKSAYGIAVKYYERLISGSIASLILCGKPGTGKTHIGCSIVKGIILSGKSAQIITVSSLMRQVKSTYNKESDITEDDLYNLYGNLDLLVIDEVGVQFGSDTEKLIFYEIINSRYNNLKPTVLISNLTTEELKGFIGERAFDRFKEDGGAVLAFDWESYRK